MNKRAESLAAFGWSCVIAEDFPRGVAALEEAFALAPQDGEISKALGLAYARTHRDVEAIVALRRALISNANDIETWCVIGELQLARRDYRAMADALGRCLKLDPNAAHPSGVRARGLIKKAEKQVRQAVG